MEKEPTRPDVHQHTQERGFEERYWLVHQIISVTMILCVMIARQFLVIIDMHPADPRSTILYQPPFSLILGFAVLLPIFFLLSLIPSRRVSILGMTLRSLGAVVLTAISYAWLLKDLFHWYQMPSQPGISIDVFSKLMHFILEIQPFLLGGLLFVTFLMLVPPAHIVAQSALSTSRSAPRYRHTQTRSTSSRIGSYPVGQLSAA